MKIRFKLFFAALIISFQTLAAPIQFEDTSNELGFTRGTETWGIAWGNLNTDKYPDLWNSGHRDFPRLYQNNGTGGFDDVSMLYDRAMNGYWLNDTQFDVHGGSWGDYDNDGDDDLIVGAEKELFINQATSGGYFIKSTISSYRQWAVWNNTDSDRALESDLTCPITRDSNYMLLFDLDNDGDTEKICGATSRFPDQVIGASSSLVPFITLSNDAAIGDFNNDLRTDIIVTRGAMRPNGASKIDSNRIEAWFRAGPATQFTFSAPGEVVFLIDGQRTGVYKEADKFVLNTNGGTSASARRVSISYQSGLWEVSFNGGGQAYVRITAQNPVTEPVMAGLDNADQPQSTYHGVNTASGIDWVFNTGLNQPRSCVSVVAADFDNDMDLDLYMACRTSVANVSNRYFDNDGDGSFTEVPSHGGEGPIGAGIEFGVAESVVTADYDVDGFMDLAVSNGLLYYPVSLGGPDTLIRNKGNGNHWVELDLIGTISPRAAIGAKVYLTAGGITQLREQSAGYHRWSQNHSRIHFGLAGNTTIEEIRVEWPSGQVNTFTNIVADALYDIQENGQITLASLGQPNPVTFSSDEECGEPPYTITLGPVLQLWRVCGTDDWRMRVRGGLSRLTQNQDLSAEGSIIGSPVRFLSAVGTSTTSIDLVDNSSDKQIDFSLTIQPGGANQKGINFNNAGQTTTCLSLNTDSTDFEVVYLGSTGKRIRLPFDLKTLQPVSSCGSNTRPVVSINNVSVTEGGTASLTVTLSPGSSQAVTVDYQTADVTATAGSDYTSKSDTLTFDPNQTSKTITINILQDTLVEGDETFNVLLSNPGNATIGDSTGEVTINDDDTGGGGPTVSVADLTVTEGGSAVFTITLSAAASNNVSVEYQTVNGSATSGSDYVSRSGVVVFNPGDTVKTRTVMTVQDSQAESVETFTMTLSNPVNGSLGQSVGTATINDDDDGSPGTFCGQPNINTSVDRTIFLWKDCSGDGKWHVRATAGGGSVLTYSGNITTDQSFSGVTPFNIESSDTLTSSAQNITFAMTMGSIWQDGFTFDLVGSGNTCFNLNAPAGIDVLVGASRIPVTPSFDIESFQVCQSDGGGPIINISDVSATEGGSAVFSIMLSAAASNNVTIDYQTVNGTATSGSDYDSRSGKIVFNPGDTLKTRTVNIPQDNLTEADETFTMSLTNPVNATLGQASGTATIHDDDGGGSACGQPNFNTSVDRTIFLWKDCTGSGNWHVRATAGGGSNKTYSGNLTTDQSFSGVTPFSIEASDTLLTSSAQVITFDMTVGSTWRDGFDFNVGTGNTCITLPQPSGESILVGASRIPITPSFDIDTLGNCVP